MAPARFNRTCAKKTEQGGKKPYIYSIEVTRINIGLVAVFDNCGPNLSLNDNIGYWAPR